MSHFLSPLVSTPDQAWSVRNLTSGRVLVSRLEAAFDSATRKKGLLGRDGLEAVDSGDVLLKLISPLRPGLVEAADGSGFVYLLMPIRLNV